MMGFKRPPKYQCQSCNRMFKSRSSHDKHVLFGRCRGMRKQKKQEVSQNIEVLSIRQQDQNYSDSVPTSSYVGRPYEFMEYTKYPVSQVTYKYFPISQANIHLRCGLPLPTISKQKYRSQAI